MFWPRMPTDWTARDHELGDDEGYSLEFKSVSEAEVLAKQGQTTVRGPASGRRVRKVVRPLWVESGPSMAGEGDRRSGVCSMSACSDT